MNKIQQYITTASKKEWAVYEANLGHKREIKEFGRFPSLKAAEKYVKSKLKIIHFEIDQDNPDAADFFANGIVYAIEPVKENKMQAAASSEQKQRALSILSEEREKKRKKRVWWGNTYKIPDSPTERAKIRAKMQKLDDEIAELDKKIALLRR